VETTVYVNASVRNRCLAPARQFLLLLRDGYPESTLLKDVVAWVQRLAVFDQVEVGLHAHVEDLVDAAMARTTGLGPQLDQLVAGQIRAVAICRDGGTDEDAVAVFFRRRIRIIGDAEHQPALGAV
jgi:predicted lipid carrier protein YhbT